MQLKHLYGCETFCIKKSSTIIFDFDGLIGLILTRCLADVSQRKEYDTLLMNLEKRITLSNSLQYIIVLIQYIFDVN